MQCVHQDPPAGIEQAGVSFFAESGQKWQIILLLCVIAVTSMSSASGADGWEGQIVSVTWENDAVAQTDRHYTQGARVGYWSADNAGPGWLEAVSRGIPSLGMEVEARKWGFAFSQEIYTPENLKTDQLVVDDRPYAGWLYACVALQRRGPARFDWPTMEILRLDAGVIGPESLADDTQKTWHGTGPGGWQNQLRTEVGVNLHYDRQYLLSVRSRDQFWGLDFIPHFGCALGNVAIYAAAGPLVRFGINLPNEFEAAGPKSAPPRFGGYLFTGIEGRAVARNLFLDGNTFTDSHSVDKIPLVGAWKVGGTLVLKKVELTAAQTFLTREFEGQKTLDSFGAATVTVKF